MVDWNDTQSVIDLSYSVIEAVGVFQQSSKTPDKQPLEENPHYHHVDDQDKLRTLISNLCKSSTCPLCCDDKEFCEQLYLDYYDVDSFIATLEDERENPYKWD